jgi:hypothetical protein
MGCRIPVPTFPARTRGGSRIRLRIAPAVLLSPLPLPPPALTCSATLSRRLGIRCRTFVFLLLDTPAPIPVPPSRPPPRRWTRAAVILTRHHVIPLEAQALRDHRAATRTISPSTSPSGASLSWIPRLLPLCRHSWPPQAWPTKNF